MIKVKRVYAPPDPADGFRVLVDRIWARGLRKADAAIDLWLKDIAPSPELRRWFAHDPAKWPEFRQRYRAELDHKDEALARLRARSRDGTLTLLFSARDEAHSNAVVLREVLESRPE